MDKRLKPCQKCGTREIYTFKSIDIVLEEGPAWGVEVFHDPDCELRDFKLRGWEPTKSKAIKRWNNFTRWDYR